MISVEEALENLLALVVPLPAETVSLRSAAGRAMAGPVLARHNQPPFAASAMDGYAVGWNRTPTVGDEDRVIGESAAGHPFDGVLTNDDGVIRIFTGARVPEGTTRVILQEDITRRDDWITVTGKPGDATHIRPAAGDFAKGTPFKADHLLGSRDIALLAAMGHGTVPVARKPVVAILMTGDELRAPGDALSAGQITASNGYGLAAMFEAVGADVRILPIARDTRASLSQSFDLAQGADLLITIGGASVGDHDLIAPAAGDAGLDLSFHKVAMRPGKPLLAGKMGDMALVGLPGNPVSAMVCGVIFILPMLRHMMGLPPVTALQSAPLAAPLDANGPRQHYMRGQFENGSISVSTQQDSSLLTVLTQATHLVVRPPRDPARTVGEHVTIIPLPA